MALLMTLFSCSYRRSYMRSQRSSFLYLLFLRICVFMAATYIVSMPANANTVAEIYSETTFVPQYGLLSETQLRVKLFQAERNVFYIGAVLQRQDKISGDDDDLYSKNRTMAVIGGRIVLWKSLTALAEYRTERRSRYGLFLGEIFEYRFKNAPLFSEFYIEAIALPLFHHNPVTSAWFKQGLRYRLEQTAVIIDPYVEIYTRRSPKADLGRDTEQARVGVRGIYLFNLWSAQILVYESFVKHERAHEEVLFVVGGEF